MCRVLEVSTSGYYAWCKRSPSARGQADAELTSRMNAIHERSHGTYGAPRLCRTRGRGHSSGTQAGGAVDADGRLGRREPAQVR
jgi:hypothetical protein